MTEDEAAGSPKGKDPAQRHGLVDLARGGAEAAPKPP